MIAGTVVVYAEAGLQSETLKPTAAVIGDTVVQSPEPASCSPAPGLGLLDLGELEDPDPPISATRSSARSIADVGHDHRSDERLVVADAEVRFESAPIAGLDLLQVLDHVEGAGLRRPRRPAGSRASAPPRSPRSRSRPPRGRTVPAGMSSSRSIGGLRLPFLDPRGCRRVAHAGVADASRLLWAPAAPVPGRRRPSRTLRRGGSCSKLIIPSVPFASRQGVAVLLERPRDDWTARSRPRAGCRSRSQNLVLDLVDDGQAEGVAVEGERGVGVVDGHVHVAEEIMRTSARGRGGLLLRSCSAGQARPGQHHGLAAGGPAARRGGGRGTRSGSRRRLRESRGEGTRGSYSRPRSRSSVTLDVAAPQRLGPLDAPRLERRRLAVRLAVAG